MLLISYPVTVISQKKSNFSKLDFMHSDYEVINEEISNINWANLLNKHDINNFVVFYEKLNSITDEYVPRKHM